MYPFYPPTANFSIFVFLVTTTSIRPFPLASPRPLGCLRRLWLPLLATFVLRLSGSNSIWTIFSFFLCPFLRHRMILPWFSPPYRTTVFLSIGRKATSPLPSAYVTWWQSSILSCLVFLYPPTGRIVLGPWHSNVCPPVQLLELSRLLGKMVSMFGITPWSRLHSRELQWLLLPYQKAQRDNSLSRLQLPDPVLRSLQWWTSNAISQGTCYREPHHVQLTTDASLTGWGAHLLHLMAQDQWSVRESLLNINLLELRAVRLTLSHFRYQVAGKDVLVLMDNTTAKAHINRLGGTRSRSLMAEALQLGLWAEEHLNSIKADHISGSANIQADALSRNLMDHREWSIPPDLFLEISARFGTPLVDLFASSANHQVPRYFSRYPEPRAETLSAAVASRAAKGIPAHPGDSQSDPEAPRSQGRADPPGSLLAPAALIRGLNVPVCGSSLAPTRFQGASDSGVPSSSGSNVASLDCLAVERLILMAANLPPDVIATIQAARRSSTMCIYEATWRSFSAWCSRASLSPTTVTIAHVLSFLQDGLKTDLAPNTLQRQVAALASVLAFGSTESLSRHPIIRNFLQGAANLRPPVVHRFPTWNLNKVLNALTASPFEPLREVSLRLLSFKVLFLGAITSAQRISELAALSIWGDLCVFHKFSASTPPSS
ncbi:uncharacterized protein LOC132711713 [Pantherophis guttatus]|uniref:Uncharacterized protein LOC132711713 n=1 Tax=Pantherophis guttatus TaxID=94885 RepID=A0ABM3ZFZ5_PANGU|nr:uncharacterized protein LOC132711713 [Pantherophis guttatus]